MDIAIMKDKFISAFMDIAVRVSQLSTAKRLKVGAIIVKDKRIISLGFNGTPYGWDNNCENLDPATGELTTKPEVLHAETNALMKLAMSNESGENAAIFITHSPCMDCAKLIYQAGIEKVYYQHDYRSREGIQFLEKCKLEIVKV